jgi:hypothetical protein
MNTKALIDRLEPWCSGWNRSTGKKNLLHVVQVAIDKLYSSDTDRFVYRGADNKGFPPYLKTAAGVYTYNVAAESLSCGNIVRTIGGASYTLVAKQVKRIFVDADRVNRDYFGYVGNSYPYINHPYGVTTQRVFVCDIAVTSQPGYETVNQPPTITFPFDPGTELTKYFCEFTYGAPRLLSEAIPIPIPARFEDDIEEFVVGYCQGKESGRVTEKVQYFNEVVVPKFHDFMASGATIENNETQPRLC